MFRKFQPIINRFIRVLALNVLSFIPLLATNYSVSSAGELEGLALSPGDTVFWLNGTYSDQEIKLVNQNGTADAPIVVRAETPGQVVFKGESTVNIWGAHLVLEGFFWQGGIGTNTHVEFRRSGSSSDFCLDCVIRNCAFDDLFTTVPEKSRWVVLYGQRNVVENCSFLNKNSTGVAILVELSHQGETTADHVIRNNYFYNITPKDDFASNSGDSETIRIGSSNRQAVRARVTVEHNYFQATDGENEIISNKSAENSYRYNTFRASRGSLVLRHGARARVQGNFFLGEGKERSGGIRVTDRDHVIINNYFQELTNENDRWNNAITIVAGDQPSGGTGNGYQRVDGILVAYNTIYQCDDPVFYNDRHTYQSTGMIAYNLVFSERGNLVAGDTEGTGSAMSYEGNIFGGDNIGITNNGITYAEETFEMAGEIFAPVPDGVVVGAASFAYADLVNEDVFGRNRPDVGLDVGAHEVDGATGTLTNQPITNEDVGNGVGVSYLNAIGHSGVALNLGASQLDTYTVTGGTQRLQITGNVQWTATADQPWITLSTTAGSGVGFIDVLVVENPEETNRFGTVTISGGGLESIVEVKQLVGLSPSNCPFGTNVAVEGEISAFSGQQNTENQVSNIIDNDPNNRWSAENFPQSATVDLGAAFSISGFNLYPHQERDYQFFVEGSNDPQSGFVTLVDARDNEVGGLVISREFDAEVYRYVRLTVTGAFSYEGPWVSISEFEVECSGNAVSTRNPAAEIIGMILRPVPVKNVMYVDNVPASYTDYTLYDFSGRIAAKGAFRSNRIDLADLTVQGMLVLRLSGFGEPDLIQKVIRW